MKITEQNKKKTGLFGRTKNVVKKKSEQESKLKEQKKMNKKNKPKGIGARRFGMVAFWLLFLFMFLVVVVNIASPGDETVNADLEINHNKLYNHEGLEFAKDFTYHYFTWTTDKHGRDIRKANLDRFFLHGLDDLGGIIFDNEWSSSIDKRDIVLKDIQKINDEQARYVFKVKFTLKSETEEEDTEIDLDKLNFEEHLREERRIKIKNGYKIKKSEKFISVPVYYNHDLDRFAVFNLPSFTFVNEDKLEDSLQDEIQKLDRLTDSYASNNLHAFLDTFFESYSKDGRDKLNYILEDERHEYGLNGSMNFNGISNTTIYRVDENNTKFIAQAEVILTDPSTNFEFMNDYLLVIRRKDQRYVVESLNDEKYVLDIVDKYTKEMEQQNNKNTNDENIDENEEFDYQNKNQLEETNDDDFERQDDM